MEAEIEKRVGLALKKAMGGSQSSTGGTRKPNSSKTQKQKSENSHRISCDKSIIGNSRVQHEQMWKQQVVESSLTPVTDDPALWSSTQSRTRVWANQALDQQLITNSEHRFLTQHCLGDQRRPRGNLLVKAHKPMSTTMSPPAHTRLHIDTVNYITTPVLLND